jgi:TolB-like protein/Tfp pilus assembly protein PilF
MAVTLELQLLGGFGAATPAGRAFDIVSKKNRALLAYLALASAGLVPRDRLVALLWSDRDDEHARNSLRQALVALRRDLNGVGPSPLIVADDTVALDPSHVRVDAVEFARLAAGGGVQALREAMALYRGDLLDGLAIRDPAFEEWIAPERERLRDLAIATLERLWLQETGEQRIAVAKRLLGLDPLREAAHRALMQAYAEQGNAAVALRQYEACRDLLRRELDVAPATETEELRRKILQNEVKPAESAAPPHESLALPDKPSIAVLPFANISGDPEQEYFADGITEDIITELSRFRTLFVIARNSSFQYRGNDIDVRRISRELGVRYVVEGSVRKSADRIRISAQLVEAVTGKHLWAERYDRDLRDTFAVQDEVTRMIVSTLAIRLEDEGLAIAKRKQPEKMQAYDYWLRGKNCLDLWNRNALLDARAFFEKAIEIDPNYARAYAGLALTYEWGAFYTAWGGGDPTARDMAERYALNAVSLDPTDHQPHVALGWIYQERRDFERSRRHLDRAEVLNPNDADMRINKAMMLSCQGEPDLAIELAQSAIRLNPYHPDWYLGYYSHCLMIARRYDEAMELRALATNILPEARAYMAVLCMLLGHMDEAKRHVDALVASFSSHWLGKPTVSFFAKLIGGYKNQADADIVIEALRKAGLPE